MKEKVSITIDAELLKQIEEIAKKQGINRSQYIEIVMMQQTKEVPVLILATDAKINGVDKALHPYKGKPLIEHQIAYFKSEGFTNIFVSMNSTKLREYLEEKHQEIRVIFEEKKLGSAGSLQHHAETLGRRFIFMYGDELVDLHLSELMKFHLRNKSGLTLVLQSVKNPSKYGVAIMEGSSIVRFEEKPGEAHSHLISIGIGVIDSSVAKTLQNGKLELQLNNVENKYGYLYEGFWKTFDEEKDFKN